MTKLDFLKQFDGTGRAPRPIQIEALKWLQSNWKGDVLAICAPTGAGKSAIARAIQIETDAHVVPPTNQLMDQYTDLYANVNALKGKVHYTCELTGLDCGSCAELNQGEYCDGCPYTKYRDKAKTEPTFFNPHSLYYFNRNREDTDTRVLVIDEAHKLRDVILGMSGKSFNSAKYTLPKQIDEKSVEDWLEELIPTIRQQALQCEKTGENKKAANLYNEASSVEMTLKGLKENPENYAIDMKSNPNRSKSLTVEPISPPRYIANQLLSCSKLILLSATLLPSDVEEILGHRDFRFLDLPSPIPKDNRAIRYVPAPHSMNAKTDPEAVAKEITKIVEKHPGENIIIHATYSLAERISKHLSFPHIRNTSENKEQTIEQYKSEGGIFLASGCSEGVDLPGNTCRVNIIPMLFRLNPTDPVVRKRLGKPGGRTWYDNEILRALIQQAGRSTRGVDDWSVTYVLDPALPRLLTSPGLKVPKSLLECIKWSVN